MGEEDSLPEGGERQWLVRSSLTGRGERRREEEMFRHGDSWLGWRRGRSSSKRRA